jgi:glycosyltransferase involved in cell wall biosynthesis
VELHVIVPGSLEQRTGGTLYDRRIVDGLRRRGWDVSVHDLPGEFPIADATARANLAEALRGLPDGARVVIDGLVMGGSPDVVQEHGPRLDLIALVHLLLADDAALQPSHRERLGFLEREALTRAGSIIATSRYTAARLADMGIDPTRIRSIPPGTEPAPRAPGPDPDAPPQLLCVAAVTPGKGQDILVRALGRIADIPWTCVCVGSLTRAPGFARRVQASVQGVGLSARVAFTGECGQDALEALYSGSSVFVLPSLYESYGMALTEAMARGLPIVSTTAGAIPDTVPADASILVPPGDDIALAGALRRLLADGPDESHGARTRRERLGAAARRHASRLPGWDQVVEAFAEAVSRPG